MCGIAGIAGRLGDDRRELIGRMLDTTPYRGPNDRGTLIEGPMTLGHLRLSIIDVSNAGHQPMESMDGRYAVIFNGEIYNYIELREELRTLGSLFRSQSDTEVIAEAYRHWGEDCVQHFNGIWAFALFDRADDALFLSRDRFGVKPLFYTFAQGELYFSSEMKALLAVQKREPNWPYLAQFFDRRTALGSDETVFQAILHLRPSHSLTWRKGKITMKRYWEPDPLHAEQAYDYHDDVATLRNLLTDAVKLQLRADVPVGVCLSGGIDSSVIAVLLAAQGVTPLTFSTVYEEQAYTERSYIEAVNAHIKATPRMLTPKSSDFFPVLEQIVHHHDEPVRMPGVYSHWHVMQCAADHVTVLLDGQGADEILAGYNDYFPSYVASLFRDALTGHGSAHAIGEIRALLRRIGEDGGNASVLLKEALARSLPGSLRSGIGSKPQKERLFSPAFRSLLADAKDEPSEAVMLARFRTVMDRDMYRTFAETNLPMLLRYEDRNSMAFSLEARVPFLDHRVVEFCQGLSYRRKIRGGTTKWILREAFKDLLPKAVYERRDKKGFPTPTAEWFKGPLKDEVRRRIANGAFLEAGLFEREAVLQLVDEHLAGTKNHERTLFRLLTLDLWLRQHDAAPLGRS